MRRVVSVLSGAFRTVTLALAGAVLAMMACGVLVMAAKASAWYLTQNGWDPNSSWLTSNSLFWMKKEPLLAGPETAWTSYVHSNLFLYAAWIGAGAAVLFWALFLYREREDTSRYLIKCCALLSLGLFDGGITGIISGAVIGGLVTVSGWMLLKAVGLSVTPLLGLVAPAAVFIVALTLVIRFHFTEP